MECYWWIFQCILRQALIFQCFTGRLLLVLICGHNLQSMSKKIFLVIPSKLKESQTKAGV